MLAKWIAGWMLLSIVWAQIPGDEVLARFDGTLRGISKKELLLDVGNEQDVTFRLVKRTTFLKDKKAVPASAVAAGSHVLVEGKKELNGDLVAVRVTLTPEEKAPAVEP